MALSPLHPKEGNPKGSNGSYGKGTLQGKTMKSGGHKVGGKGQKSSRGKNVGKAGSY